MIYFVIFYSEFFCISVQLLLGNVYFKKCYTNKMHSIGLNRILTHCSVYVGGADCNISKFLNL